MIHTAWPTEDENWLADEALRIIPGIALAGLERRPDMIVLYQAYLDEARKRGVPLAKAWQIFGVTSMSYAQRVIELESQVEDVPFGEVAQHIALRIEERTQSDA